MSDQAQSQFASESPSHQRSVTNLVNSLSTLEGGGFPVRRPFPTETMDQVDPFVLLDHMGPVTWGPREAIGAPDHPHRGFETVTYLLEGQMEHRDSTGHQGRLGPGDVQWMTAGSGVVHSEMPTKAFYDTGGITHGFQIWVNLPRSHKMVPPRYQEIPSSAIPVASDHKGLVTVRVIAGQAMGLSAVINTITPISFLHFTIHPRGQHQQLVPKEHNALVYVISGHALVGAEQQRVQAGQMALLGQGDFVKLAATRSASSDSQLLLLSGTPLRQPMARQGPFVMNTREELHQAFLDYQQGLMGSIKKRSLT